MRTGSTVFFAAVMMFNLSGCSFLIPMTGDYIKKDFTVVTVMDLHSVDKGSEVVVVLKNGRRLNGKYLGLKYFSESEYAAKYNIFQKSKLDQVILPELGDTVTVALYPEVKHSGEFLGFNYGYQGVICLRPLSDRDSVKIDLEKARYVENNTGHSIRGTTLRELMMNSRIPCLSGITIQSDSLEITLGADEINRIEVSTAEKRSLELFISLLYFVGIGFVTWFFSTL